MVIDGFIFFLTTPNILVQNSIVPSPRVIENPVIGEGDEYGNIVDGVFVEDAHDGAVAGLFGQRGDDVVEGEAEARCVAAADEGVAFARVGEAGLLHDRRVERVAQTEVRRLVVVGVRELAVRQVRILDPHRPRAQVVEHLARPLRHAHARQRSQRDRQLA